MLQLTSIDPLRALVLAQRQRGRRIGFVPTMGNLHAGHLSLIAAAKAHCDYVIASIFVNPLQFGPSEDFGRYPRTLDADKVLLTAAGCDGVFTPAVDEIYPLPLTQQTKISVPHLAALYCGKSRPGHFDGVCTVVCKLFNMVQPDMAFFGLKDFQQFFLIRRMVTDLQLPLQLVGLPTVREATGLALSSRNGYLNAHEREQATSLYATLTAISTYIRQGERDYPALENQALAKLVAAGLRPDYFHVVDADTLLPPYKTTTTVALLVAAFAGNTRLIDNLTLALS